jgi:hypothetical protein
VATDKASYDLGDVLHATTTVNVVSAPAPLTNVSVVTTINGSSTTKTIPTIAPGASATTTVDYAVGTSAPGTYVVAVVVNGNVQASTSFTIISTATSGKGITGTLTATSPVTQGASLPLTATIANAGNAAVPNGSFAVKIGSDSLPFTLTVPLGGNASKSLSYATASLAPGNYNATLVSLITGSPVTLATAPFTVTAIPTSITASVATDKASYDVGDVLHATTTVNVVSAPAPLTNVSVVTTINGTSTTQTIPTIAPGASATTTVDYAVGTNAPGTYVVAVVVNGNVQASTSFTIISTATSGKGITGTLTATSPVTQGASLPLTATIANAGNAAVPDGSFAVKIGSDSLPFTLTVPLAGNASKSLSYATTSLAPGNYTATLVSLITGSPVTLASTTFTVTSSSPQTTMTLTSSTTARVLIWSDCSPGNSGKACTPPTPPFLTSTLTNAGMGWTLVGYESAFVDALRTGTYSVAVMAPPPTNTTKQSGEVKAAVHAGTGLLILKDHPDAMPDYADAIGVSFNGKLKGPNLLDVLATPVAPAGQLNVNGDGVKLTLGRALAAARISATQAAAISYNTFGSGHAIVVPFDVEQTATTPMAQFLLAATRYTSRNAGTDARGVVPIDVAVTAPTGGSVSATVRLDLPLGFTVVDALPHLTATSPPSWTVTVASGATSHLIAWLRLPNAIGSYTVTSTLTVTGQTPAVRTLGLTVTADRAAIEAALTADLNALATAVPSKDVHIVTHAQNELTAARNATPTTAAGVSSAIDHILNIVSDLESLSTGTTVARRDTDRLLSWWQSGLPQ